MFVLGFLHWNIDCMHDGAEMIQLCFVGKKKCAFIMWLAFQVDKVIMMELIYF